MSGVRSPVYESYNIEVGVTDFNTPLGLAAESEKRNSFFRNHHNKDNKYSKSSESRVSKKSSKSLPTRIMATPNEPGNHSRGRDREAVRWIRPDLRDDSRRSSSRGRDGRSGSRQRYADDDGHRRARSSSRGRSKSTPRSSSRSKPRAVYSDVSESRASRSSRSKTRTKYSDLFETDGTGPPSSARYYSGERSTTSRGSRGRSVSPSMLEASRSSTRHRRNDQRHSGDRSHGSSRGHQRSSSRERYTRSESPHDRRNSFFNFSGNHRNSRADRRHEMAWQDRLSPNSVWSRAYDKLSPNSAWGSQAYNNSRSNPRSGERIRFDQRLHKDYSEKVGDFRCKPIIRDDGTIHGYELGRSEFSVASVGSTRSTSSSALDEFVHQATKKGRPMIFCAIVCCIILCLLVVAAVVYIYGIQSTPWGNSGGSGGNDINAATEFPSIAPIDVDGRGHIGMYLTATPSHSPTLSRAPTFAPTKSPTKSPTKNPTRSPTTTPSASPTKSPSSTPTSAPSSAPSFGPDPACEMGVRSSVFCCHPSCGECGGDDCASYEGGEENCCTSNIILSFRDCSVVGPPCVVTSV